MAAIALLASATSAHTQALTYTDLIGWWRSDLAYNGEHAEMYIRFAEEGGMPVVRVTLPPIHGWDFPFGTAKVSGNRVQFNAVPLALEFDPTAGTLSRAALEQLATDPDATFDAAARESVRAELERPASRATRGSVIDPGPVNRETGSAEHRLRYCDLAPVPFDHALDDRESEAVTRSAATR
jgi:hypothetical protein